MKKGTRIGLVSLLLALGFAITAQAELTVTEIMSQSIHSGSTDSDWWELTNTGKASVNLAGYSWDDDHQIPGQNIFGDITIGPGKSIILYELTNDPGDAWKVDWDLGPEVAVYGPSWFGGGFSSFGAADGAFVFNPSGQLIASASYIDRMPGSSNAWDTNGKYLGISAPGVDGAYRSDNPNPDTASPGYAKAGAVDAPTEFIYWSDKNIGKIQRANRNGGQIEEILTSADGLAEPRGLAIDLTNEKMYWADGKRATIQRANLDGSDIEVLYSGFLFPTDIALDLKHGKIYFSDTGVSKILRANIDGSGPIEEFLTGLGTPYYIELDLIGNMLYWSDLQNTYIRRKSLDGDQPAEDFITGLTYVRDIAVDTFGGRIFWGDRGASTIQRMNLDGTGPIETLYGPWNGLDRPHGLALDIDEGKIYWTDTRTYSVHRGDMNGSGPLESIATGLDGPWSIGMILPKPDSDKDGFVDFADFARFAQGWLSEDCGFCRGADYNSDNIVNPADLQIFADQWLATP